MRDISDQSVKCFTATERVYKYRVATNHWRLLEKIGILNGYHARLGDVRGAQREGRLAAEISRTLIA